MIRLTAKAAVTNVHVGYLLAVSGLGLITVMGVLSPIPDYPHFNLLMSIGVSAAAAFGVFAGTTLAEIKVKPLSYMLPGQEGSMAPAMLVVGTVVCATFAALVLQQPMSIVDIPAAQQALSVFGFGLGVFMLIVAACVVTRDTAYLPLVSFIPMLLLLAAMNNETAAVPWLAMNAALAERPLLSLLFAALGVGLAFSVLGDRELSRRMCGAPFLPLKAYDNPFRIEDYRSRVRSTSFRPSLIWDSRSPPGGALLAALSRRLAGTSWNYLVLDTRISRNPWEFLWRFASLLISFVVVMYAWQAGFDGPLSPLFYFVVLAFAFFPPTFKPRLSPMLPVSRRQHFRSFVAKAVSIYGLAILGMLLLKLVVGAFPGLGDNVSSAVPGVAELSVKGILVTAAAIPVVCWAYSILRSTFAFGVIFSVLFVAAGAYEPLVMAMSYRAVLLVSVLCWLPFIYIAWQRCYRDDLLLP